MAIYWPTPGFKGRTFKLCVLTRWDFNFCVRSSPLRGSKRAYQLVKHLTTVKQGKATTVQNRSGKCLTEERQILNRWTEYSSELYNHKANGDPSVLKCHLHKEVQSLKKGKSAELTTSQQNWSKQVEKRQLLLSRHSATWFGRQENGQHRGLSP